MIEQKLENIVIQQIQDALSDSSLSADVQILGSWTLNDQIKNYEGHLDNVVTVKVNPRSYDTPTIPDAQLVVEIVVLSRIECDTTGEKWLQLVDAISQKLQAWQKAYSEYYPVFKLDGEFEPTGFNLNGGDVGKDSELDAQLFSQTFTIYGIIQS